MKYYSDTFDKDGKRYDGNDLQVRYPPWLESIRDWNDTVQGAIRCHNAMVRLINSPGANKTWITADAAAVYAGLPPNVVKQRVYAAYHGCPSAWPWTAVKRDGGFMKVCLPELWEEVQWVFVSHVADFVGVGQRAVINWCREEEYDIEPREFRGGKYLCIRLNDAIRLKQRKQVRNLLGRKLAIDDVSVLPPEVVSEIAALRALRKLK